MFLETNTGFLDPPHKVYNRFLSVFAVRKMEILKDKVIRYVIDDAHLLPSFFFKMMIS